MTHNEFWKEFEKHNFIVTENGSIREFETYCCPIVAIANTIGDLKIRHQNYRFRELGEQILKLPDFFILRISQASDGNGHLVQYAKMLELIRMKG